MSRQQQGIERQEHDYWRAWVVVNGKVQERWFRSRDVAERWIQAKKKEE